VGLGRVQSGDSGWVWAWYSLVTVGGTRKGIVWWQWVGLDRVQSVTVGGAQQDTVWWQWVGLDRGQVVVSEGSIGGLFIQTLSKWVDKVMGEQRTAS